MTVFRNRSNSLVKETEFYNLTEKSNTVNRLREEVKWKTKLPQLWAVLNFLVHLIIDNLMRISSGFSVVC